MVSAIRLQKGDYTNQNHKGIAFAGLETATNLVANATNKIALATKTSMAVAKLSLDFTQTSSPYGKRSQFFSQF